MSIVRLYFFMESIPEYFIWYRRNVFPDVSLIRCIYSFYISPS